MLFSNNLFEKRHLSFKNSNQKIKITSNQIYLGIMFDSKFKQLLRLHFVKENVLNLVLGFKHFKMLNTGIDPSI